MFWNKKIPEKVISYDDMMERIKKMEGKIARLEAETMDIMIAQHTMRDKVMKKIKINDKKNGEDEAETWNGLPLG